MKERGYGAAMHGQSRADHLMNFPVASPWDLLHWPRRTFGKTNTISDQRYDALRRTPAQIL
jgi:hypothetical protein